ncbi:DUF4089 domain-containing protein [Leptolyngbya sp. FACHB-36]|uniref:DUF4089 domain-containing protein n=1 Tax=Leptolyngbya sp. FACHB-36 TaxID=2692808 RepID=UPI001680E138|nr:DUF4089 domain-containing protein [Leptolyngbya sp. FACHB-36]MBD2022376.1 DUF4089 domain-containing protein [Leptolyngbya sp. FACHB-36]
MTDPIDPSAFVDAAAALIGLPIPPDYRPSVIANFERIQAIAQLVNEFPLPDDVEVGPTFDP